MGGIDWVWQFGLYPIDESEHDSCRAAACVANTVWAWLLTYAIEPAGFVMTRRMLLGLKQRAEALRERTPALAGDTHRNRNAA